MPTPNIFDSLRGELGDLGLDAGMTVMVHSSLGKVGWTVGGPVTVIRALLDVIGTTGTLVMPAETPQVSDPSTWRDDRVQAEWHDTIREHLPVFDLLTTPTTMGAIPEAFRTFPGTLRSNHPLASACANGPLASDITAEHSFEFCEGAALNGTIASLMRGSNYSSPPRDGIRACSSMRQCESTS